MLPGPRIVSVNPKPPTDFSLDPSQLSSQAGRGWLSKGRSRSKNSGQAGIGTASGNHRH